MLRSQSFSKATAYTGIVAGGLSVVPPTIGTIGVFFSFIALVPTAAWLVLTGRSLVRLAR
jgi:hypothetical protein